MEKELEINIKSKTSAETVEKYFHSPFSVGLDEITEDTNDIEIQKG